MGWDKPARVDLTPDPNPVKIRKDGYGGTKMEYQARPTGKITPHVKEEGKG